MLCEQSAGETPQGPSVLCERGRRRGEGSRRSIKDKEEREGGREGSGSGEAQKREEEE